MFVMENPNSSAGGRKNGSAGVKKKIITAAASVAAVAVVAAAGAVGYSMSYINSGKVLKGVSLDGRDLGGAPLSVAKETAQSIAAESLSAIDSTCVVLHDVEYDVPADELEVRIDTAGVFDRIESLAKKGNVFQNTAEFYSVMSKGAEFSTDMTLNEQRLDEFLDTLETDARVEKTQPQWQVVDSGETKQLSITSGTDGVMLDRQATTDAITQALAAPVYGNRVQAVCTVDKCEEIDISAIHDDVYTEAESAVIIIEQDDPDGSESGAAENGEGDAEQYNIKREVIGIDFDEAEAKSRVEGLGQGEKVMLDLIVTQPETTYDQLRAMLFADELASYSTKLNTALIGRTNNIRLGSQKINGYVLNPGDVFSFNKVVGKRTYEAGFRDAKIYQGDTMVDDLGGGICQITSTLYAATLLADMETVERHNHRFTVTYIPLGYDATVFYGSLDFKFRNNMQYPVKIDARLNGGTLTIKLMGTKTEDKRVELSTSSYNRVPHGEKVIVDETMEPGSRKVDVSGTNGITVDTYKTIYIDGVQVSRKFIHTSKYVPCDTVVYVGPEATPAEGGTAEPTDPAAPVSGPGEGVEPTIPAEPAVPVEPVTQPGDDPAGLQSGADIQPPESEIEPPVPQEPAPAPVDDPASPGTDD